MLHIIPDYKTRNTMKLLHSMNIKEFTLVIELSVHTTTNEH